MLSLPRHSGFAPSSQMAPTQERQYTPKMPRLMKSLACAILPTCGSQIGNCIIASPSESVDTT